MDNMLTVKSIETTIITIIITGIPLIDTLPKTLTGTLDCFRWARGLRRLIPVLMVTVLQLIRGSFESLGMVLADPIPVTSPYASLSVVVDLHPAFGAHLFVEQN